MRKRLSAGLVAGALVLTVLDGQAADGYRLIAHPAISLRSLSRAEASRIFLKRSAKWPDGSPATPVDLPPDSKTREAFSRDVHGKSASAVDAYWQKQVFSGSALPPATRANDGEVIRFVRATAGAVGYVAADADLSGVRSIEVQ
jgi:ABC-type phosphate transport system substrate-binding protein